MKNTSWLILLPFLIVLLSSNSNHLPCSGVIELVFSGNQSKSIPIIIFSTSEINNKYDSTLVYKFKVSCEQFKSIRKAIEKNRQVVDDTILKHPYDFNIFSAEASKIVSVYSLKKIREISKEIDQEFKSFRKSSEIEDVFRVVVSSLKYEGNR